MANYSIYGNQNTHLKLTGKAYDIYSNADPLRIFEFHDPETDNYTYDVHGIIEAEDLTEEELIKSIEELGEIGMTIYGRAITQKDMDVIGTYMDDDIRETVHFELAPCTPEEFLTRYLELDPDFEELLTQEFEFKR